MASDKTTLLALPYIAAAQAQKHVTHNDALRMLDALVQLTVKSDTTASPPATPTEGDRYIAPTGATGAFAGTSGAILAFQDGGWARYTPTAGWLAYVADRQETRVFDGTAWQPSVMRLTKLGLNADADTVNRLSIGAQATLLSHDGAGHQLKLNKRIATDTASLLYQTGFSGRAEMGLAGSDAFSIKVSADGTSWREAIAINATTGIVGFTQGAVANPTGTNLLINGDFQVNQRTFAGGALAAAAYGYDRWKGGASGATLSRSGLYVTLSAGAVAQVIEPAAFGETSLASRSFTISIADLSGGTLTARLGSASATLSAGVPTATILATSAADTGALTFSLTVLSGTPVFSRVKLEAGSLATGWQARPFTSEMALCQRYYETSVPYGQNPLTYAPGAGNGSIYAAATSTGGSVTQLRYLVPKRATPTVTIRDGVANAGKISVYNGSWLNNFAYTGTLGATDKGLSLQQNNSGVVNVSFDFTADAEL